MAKSASPLVELITGSAHDSLPTDVTVPLGERFRGQSVLAVIVAKERAAVMRLRFDAKGQAIHCGTKQIEHRARELGTVLTAEAKAFGTQDVVMCVMLGWFVDIGVSSTRSDTHQAAFARYKVMLDTPDDILPGAKTEFVYTAIDHPTLDKSVVFSVRRADVVAFMEEIRRAGLRVVSVRCSVAALFELWMARRGVEGLHQDLLVTDGASAFLLNVRDGSFVPPRSDSVEEQKSRPRQSTSRPNDVLHDILGYCRELEGHSKALTIVGPQDTAHAVKDALDGHTLRIEHPAAPEFHDAAMACFAPEVLHDLNPDAREERPRIPARSRKFVLGYLALVVLLILTLGVHVYAGFANSMAGDDAEERAMSADRRERTTKTSIDNANAELRVAEGMRRWIAGNYHAQEFMLNVLRAVPEGSSIESVDAKLQEGSAQMLFTFTLLGSEQAQQEACTRSIETTLIHAGYKIGQREQPVQSGRTISYTWRLILPENSITTISQ